MLLKAFQVKARYYVIGQLVWLLLLRWFYTLNIDWNSAKMTKKAIDSFPNLAPTQIPREIEQGVILSFIFTAQFHYFYCSFTDISLYFQWSLMLPDTLYTVSKYFNQVIVWWDGFGCGRKLWEMPKMWIIFVDGYFYYFGPVTKCTNKAFTGF